jgi:hypothetical protein
MSKPQFVSLKNGFGDDLLIPHCPFCGIIALKDGSIQECDHLQLIYFGELGEYEFKSKYFEESFSKLSEAEQEDISLETYESCGYDNNLILYEVTNSGMACGPVHYVDIYGYSKYQPGE